MMVECSRALTGSVGVIHGCCSRRTISSLGVGRRSATVPHHRRQEDHPLLSDEPWDTHHAPPWVEGEAKGESKDSELELGPPMATYHVG
jgi:hypothetical protein